MSKYLPPKLHNGKANILFNASDYNYQFENLSYSLGDDRYVTQNNYNTEITLIDSSFNSVNSNIGVIQTKVQNITYDASNNRTNTQNINAGSIYQPDGFKINQSTGSSTAYNYLQNTNVTNLNVTGTLSIPSGTTINGATYNSDIVLTNPARINQSGTGINNLNSTNFTGNITVSGTLQGLSPSIYGFLNSITSNVQTQLSNLQTTTSQQSYSTGTTSFTNNVSVSGTLQGLSPSIYGFLNTISSNVQTQLNSLSSNLGTTNSTVSSNNTNLQNQITTNANSISTLNSNLTSTNSTVSSNNTNLQNQITTNTNSISTLNSNLTSTNSTVSSNNTNLQSQISTLQTKTTNMSYSSTGNNTFFNSNVYVSSLNEISNTRLSMLTDLGTTSTVETRFYNINSFINSISPFFTNISTSQNFNYNMNWATENFHAGQNIDVSQNIVFGSSINGISSNVFNFLSGTSSNIQSQFNNITANYIDKSTAQTITGTKSFTNLNFSGSINSISSSTMAYVSNVTADIQSQFNNITANYIDKSTTQTITGTKTISNLNVNNLVSTGQITCSSITSSFQKKQLYLTDSGIINVSSSYPTPVYYNTNTSVGENLPNMCYVHLTAGCSNITVPSLDNSNDYGKTFILCNRTNASVTVNSPYPSYFIGFVGDGTNSFILPPFGRAIICNNSSNWDVIYISSYYDWGRGGVYILGSGTTGNPYDNTIQFSYSCPDLTNMLNQPNISSSLTSSDRQDFSSSISGSYTNLNAYAFSGADCAVVYPNFGCVVYNNTNYSGTILLNYKNSTLNPVCVKMSSLNAAKSIKIYYFDQLIVNL
jgi:hypothetical protein